MVSPSPVLTRPRKSHPVSRKSDDFGVVHYYGYRYYHTNLGRWLSRDPIGERGGLNLYKFVENNPIGKFDYLGNLPAPQEGNKDEIPDNQMGYELLSWMIAWDGEFKYSFCCSGKWGASSIRIHRYRVWNYDYKFYNSGELFIPSQTTLLDKDVKEIEEITKNLYNQVYTELAEKVNNIILEYADKGCNFIGGKIEMTGTGRKGGLLPTQKFVTLEVINNLENPNASTPPQKPRPI